MGLSLYTWTSKEHHSTHITQAVLAIKTTTKSFALFSHDDIAMHAIMTSELATHTVGTTHTHNCCTTACPSTSPLHHFTASLHHCITAPLHCSSAPQHALLPLHHSTAPLHTLLLLHCITSLHHSTMSRHHSSHRCSIAALHPPAVLHFIA